MRKVPKCIPLCILLYICIFVIFHYKSTHTHIGSQVEILGSKGLFLPLEIPNATKRFQEKTLILLWSGMDDVSDHNFGGCPDYGCSFTRDKKLLSTSKAVIFSAPYHTDVFKEKKERYPWQYYVFYSLESPSNTAVVQPYPYFFNLTMGYRRDADVPSPYGYAVVKNKRLQLQEDEVDLMKVIAGKKKMVAWFVSNCDASSHRLDYVKELQKWITVDIYGACGNYTCQRGLTVNNLDEKESSKTPLWPSLEKTYCDNMLERDYKFYLSFENSVCRDYITEKFWLRLTLKIVPIVLKRGVVDKYAPPGSFLAADDFESPKALAMHLHELANDNRKYAKRFDWTHKYSPIFLDGREHDVRERPWGFCRLCHIITANAGRVDRRRYENINEWWQASCDNELVTRLLSQGKKSEK